MQTIRIQTAQNIDIDYEMAGLGDRILGRLIDIAIFVALVIIAIIVSTAAGSKIFSTVILIIMAAFLAFYDLVCEIFFNGQSIGKRAMKIKVISLNGGRPTIGQYLLRWLFRIVDFSITGGVCALISVAVSEKKQRVGDIVAGTTLIRTAPRTHMDHVAFPSIPEDYTPTFPQATLLSDRDMALIKEVITGYERTANWDLIDNLAQRIKDLLSVSTPYNMNNLEFLQTLLKDHTYLLTRVDA
jgi:uncharacterized RDD family membrane protein YckC